MTRSNRKEALLGLSCVLAPVVGSETTSLAESSWCASDASKGTECQRTSCDVAANRDSYIPGESAPVITLNIRFHVIGRFWQAQPDYPVTSGDLDDQLGQLNTDFSDYGIQFVRATDRFHINAYLYDLCPGSTPCSDYDECPVCSTDIPYNQRTPECKLKTGYSEDPATDLRVYIVKSADWLGFAHFPWCSDAIGLSGGVIIDADYIGGGCGKGCKSVLTHEIGHALGLWHTFYWDGDNCSDCYESAACDGTCSDPACDEVGDFCCDTAACEGSFPGCGPSGGDDTCPDPDQPWPENDYTNFMGDQQDGCWNHFTPQQSGRMHCYICEYLQQWIVGTPGGNDCNENESKDVCDILTGVSEDCDENGVPDECQSRGACCTVTYFPLQFHCTDDVVEVCCAGEWKGSSTACASTECIDENNSTYPGGE